MDLNDIEGIDLNTLGSTDATTVNDLSGTDVVEINVNQAGTIQGSAGDDAADIVIVNGTNGADIVDVLESGTSVAVLGLPARVNITGSEAANDSLVINALGGTTGYCSTTVPAGIIVTIDGAPATTSSSARRGPTSSSAAATTRRRRQRQRCRVPRRRRRRVPVEPGDGNDTIEGQGGHDEMLFFGANVAGEHQAFANGGRVIFFRDIASVAMDLDDVESIDFRALGGADTVIVGDLVGTDVTAVGVDLRGPNGGGDGAADAVTVNGTQGADSFGAAGDAGGVTVFGLQAAVNIFGPEQVSDRLTLNGLAGDGSRRHEPSRQMASS